jgi:murein L,D-transpeptidase YcbB/YkuD
MGEFSGDRVPMTMARPARGVHVRTRERAAAVYWETMRRERLVRRAIIAATLMLLCAGARGALAAPPPAPAPSPRGVEALLQGGPHPWLAHSDLDDVRDSLRAFYTRRGNDFCWLDWGRASARARAWVEALGRLDDYGVPAVECDVPQLAAEVAAFDRDRSRSAEELGDLDVAISASIMRALRALHSGRLDPALVDSNLILLHRPLALSLALDSLSRTGDPDTWLDRVQPRFRQYRTLIEALARYRQFATDPKQALPLRPPRLNTGRRTPGIARLRRTLEWTGDLKWGSVRRVAADSMADARLAAAIGRFQRRHRLSVTGKLDSVTWVGMRGALAERVEQIGRTLEQYRWLPHELTAPLLFVNIPAFRLEAMDRLDEPESAMLRVNVVVGTAYKTQTPVLTAALTSVDFMPGWDVPPSIAKNEVLTNALADSTYLERNHMDLIQNMKVLPPTRVNIERIGKGVRVRQRPGPDNPLGRVKFVMPNQYDIYLHDTPSRGLFQARQRDFSHGCIRLGDATALARYVLRDRPDWTPARIDSAMKDSTTLKVRLPIPMLVAIVYATSQAREDGSVAFLPDVYGHDRRLQLLLAGAPKDTLIAERGRAIARRHPPPPPRDTLWHAPMVPPHPPGVMPPPVMQPAEAVQTRRSP